MPLLANAQMTVSGAPGTAFFPLGFATAGAQTFAAAGAKDGDSLSYTAIEGATWEIGIGAYVASNGRLNRTTVLFNSAGTTVALSFGAGVIVSQVALPGDIQTPLGFLPVQQGGGPRQLANKIQAGWTATGLGLAIDTVDQGNIWLDAFAPKSLAANGYQKLPSGLILQWGSVQNSASDFSVTLPTTFPNVGLIAVPGVYFNYGTSGTYTATTDSLSTTGFNIRCRAVTAGSVAAQGALPVNWFALGY